MKKSYLIWLHILYGACHTLISLLVLYAFVYLQKFALGTTVRKDGVFIAVTIFLLLNFINQYIWYRRNTSKVVIEDDIISLINGKSKVDILRKDLTFLVVSKPYWYQTLSKRNEVLIFFRYKNELQAIDRMRGIGFRSEKEANKIIEALSEKVPIMYSVSTAY